MLKKLSLRWRLTAMTALMICACCVGLTLVLNFSAYRLANHIEAATTTPAQEGSSAFPAEDLQPMLPLTPSEYTDQAKVEYQLESILYMAAAVLLGSALTYYIAGRALEPVKSLNRQVKNLGVNNLSETLEVPPTNDEIAELTVSFNEMTDKLHEAFGVQQRFSMNAAHELRTPLTVLQTKIDVFHKKEQHTPGEYDALIAAVQKQTVRLRGLIKNLLDMTNLEDSEQQEVPLGDLFGDILGELSGLAEEKKVTLSLECGQESLYGNPDLLYRAFCNLVENAVKYNVPGGSVLVEVRGTPANGVAVFIKDTGIGIPDELKKQIFEPFFRVDKSRSREMGGAGLGLSIVDSIVKKYGGTIELTNYKPRGTCIKLAFDARQK